MKGGHKRDKAVGRKYQLRKRKKSFEFNVEKSISISNSSRQPEASRVRARVGGKETASVSTQQYFSTPQSLRIDPALIFYS